jgi:ABC-type proline/glycine betaine transport system permease subunit
MGYGPLRRLITVELPLAVPVTIAAHIGLGGLGRFIIDGQLPQGRGA